MEVSPSTVTQLKEASAAARSIVRSRAGATAASVVRKESMVAMRGWIMPAPLATPAKWTGFPANSVRSTQHFETVSVVMMA